MKFSKLLTSVAVVSGLMMAGAVEASAESTLDIVKKRGHLRCQVGKPAAGTDLTDNAARRLSQEPPPAAGQSPDDWRRKYFENLDELETWQPEGKT